MSKQFCTVANVPTGRALLSQLDGQQKLEWAQAFLDGSFVPAKKGAMV
jgi:hypothetical protein